VEIAYPQAALDIIAGTLVSSMVLLALSFMPFRGELAQFGRRGLVVASFVLQASCIGTIWLHQGKYAMSTALLAVAVATVVVMAVLAIRRETFWTRLRK
jgi:Na+/H+-translocating membrane pyrophosphatase